jgi:hypothetical protein
MLISRTEQWLDFKIEREDWVQDPEAVKKFLAEIRYAIPPEDRHYYQDRKLYRIRANRIDQFDAIRSKHFRAGAQQSFLALA